MTMADLGATDTELAELDIADDVAADEVLGVALAQMLAACDFES